MDFEYIKHQTELLGEAELFENSFEFYNRMNSRRTVRDFSDKPVPEKVIENILLQQVQHHRAHINNPGHFVW